MEQGAVVVRTEGLMSAPVDDDLVVLNAERDSYGALDAIGRRIWELLEAPLPVAELCAQLGEEFDGEPAPIAADVSAFLDELEQEGLVRVVDERRT